MGRAVGGAGKETEGMRAGERGGIGREGDRQRTLGVRTGSGAGGSEERGGRGLPAPAPPPDTHSQKLRRRSEPRGRPAPLPHGRLLGSHGDDVTPRGRRVAGATAARVRAEAPLLRRRRRVCAVAAGSA